MTLYTGVKVTEMHQEKVDQVIGHLKTHYMCLSHCSQFLRVILFFPDQIEEMNLLVILLLITNIQHSTSKKYLNRTRINSDIFPHLAPQVTRNRVTLPYYLITYILRMT